MNLSRAANQPVHRIVITGDILRPNPNGQPDNQASNIRWLHGLLEPMLRAAVPGVPIQALNNIDDAHAFYAAAGRSCSPEAWMQLVDADIDAAQLPEPAHDWFAERFQGALVLGYELPPCFTALAAAQGLAWLNVVVHPLRFLDDLVLGLSTNVQSLDACLEAHRLPESAIRAGADHCRAFFSTAKAPAIEPGALLVAGQSAIDRSLLHAGRLWHLGDFTERLAALAAMHDRVYYKPHPIYPQKAVNVADLFGGSAVQSCEANIYQVLAHAPPRTVVAISSGVLQEAPWFGVNAERLLGRPAPTCTAIPAAAYHARFWAELLAPLLPTDSSTELTLPCAPNRLREGLGWYWGYRELAPAPPQRRRWWWPFR